MLAMPISEVHNCDCMDFMRDLPDNFFDLAIADPPYGIDIGDGLGSGKKNCKMHHSWQFDAPNQDFFDELFRVSKEQIIWGGNYFHLPLCDNWIVWDKLNPNLSFAEGELAWCSIHRKLRIFKHYSAKVDGSGKIHPTQKPVALYAWLIDNYLLKLGGVNSSTRWREVSQAELQHINWALTTGAAN